MPLSTYTARCTSHAKIAHDVFVFTLEKPQGFAFQAGQFVLFQVPLVGKPEDIQPRAFSIASSPDEKELLFIAKIKEGGRAGRWISETLHVGSDVRFQGPAGAFFLDQKTDKDYLFLCTSSGVAPFRSHIHSALERGDRRKMDLVFCVRNEEEIFWLKEFQDLERAHQNFHVHLTLSQPSPQWKGLCGRVQVVVPGAVHDYAKKSVYICGNPEMLKEVKACCEAWGVGKQDLHTEGYF